MLRLEGCSLNKEWLTQTLMTISKEDNPSFKFDGKQRRQQLKSNEK